MSFIYWWGKKKKLRSEICIFTAVLTLLQVIWKQPETIKPFAPFTQLVQGRNVVPFLALASVLRVQVRNGLSFGSAFEPEQSVVTKPESTSVWKGQPAMRDRNKQTCVWHWYSFFKDQHEFAQLNIQSQVNSLVDVDASSTIRMTFCLKLFSTSL